MHQQGTRDPEQVDAVILELLNDRDSQRPWSVEEVVREVGGDPEASDGIARLVRAGLCHRLSGFVWASRAALHAERLRL
jgi:hypothetical protein